MEFISELRRNNVLVLDSQILPKPAAIRLENGTLNQDLPENLGGFFIIDVDDYETAIALARSCPHNQVGAVELHALNETEENAYQPGI